MKRRLAKSGMMVLLVVLMILCILLGGCSTKKNKKEQDEDDDVAMEASGDLGEEDSSEEKQNESKKIENKELSDDVYSFQIKVDDMVYQFPMTYKDFVALGWTYKDDDSEKLDPNQYTVGEVFTKGDLTIYANIFNFSINSEPISNCLIGGISFDDYLIKKDEATILLPGGIQYGVATIKDIKAAYGDPTDIYEGTYYTELTYTKDSYQDIKLQVDKESNCLSSVDICNFVEIEGASKGEVSSETPDIVNAYKAPSGLGDDFSAFIVEYDGALYKLPAPVNEFIKNGWVINEDDSDEYVSANSYGWISLRKNNQTLRASVNNYTDNATIIVNCFVTDVKGDEYSTDIPITVQKGIKKGMTKEALEKALTGVKFEKEDSTSIIYYTINCGEGVLDKIEIIVNKETSKVNSIEVTNSPKDYTP